VSGAYTLFESQTENIKESDEDEDEDEIAGQAEEEGEEVGTCLLTACVTFNHSFAL
jgi:hypothetical protein